MQVRKSKPAAYFDRPSMNVQATASQFKQFRTEVADAIREKTGSTEAINPKDFAEQIKNLSGSNATLGYRYFDVSESPYNLFNKLVNIFEMVESGFMSFSALAKAQMGTSIAIVDIGIMCLTNGSGIPDANVKAIALAKNSTGYNQMTETTHIIDLYDFLHLAETATGSEDLSYIDFLKNHEITEAEFLEGTVEGLPQMPE